MENVVEEKTIYRAFRIGVFLKGVGGVLETLGGLLLLAASTSTLGALATLLTGGELSEDPNDFIATRIIQIVSGISVDTKTFGVMYLFTHGIVNILLAIGLLKNKLAVYPAAMGILVVFMAYQLYRITLTHSLVLVGLTLFDAAVIALTYHQYRHLRAVSRT